MDADAVDRANRETAERLSECDPVLVGVDRAIDVVPGMTTHTILVAGTRQEWDRYHGPQRDAILYAAVHEGLASDVIEAEGRILAGEILIEPTQAHDCGGSSTGVHSASTPMFIVHNRAHGNYAYSGLYEAKERRLLALGVYDDVIRARLHRLAEVIAPTLASAIRTAGGIPLRPIISRALRMGDELHSRNVAATALLMNELVEPLYSQTGEGREAVMVTLRYLRDTEPLFLRLSLASAKAAADGAHGVRFSSIVTGMILNCNAFAIRIGGLGKQEWFEGPLPEPQGRFFDGFSADDVVWTGGESCMVETVGLGGFAQASAFALQEYAGGAAETMVDMNRAMYGITVAEHPEYRIPFFAFRGVPIGIDMFKVLDSGVMPVIDAGYAAPDVGLIGAGTFRPPLECFGLAMARFREEYAEVSR